MIKPNYLNFLYFYLTIININYKITVENEYLLGTFIELFRKIDSYSKMIKS